jgi:hypothetical protein
MFGRADNIRGNNGLKNRLLPAMLGIKRELKAGELRAVFVPSRGMPGVSLRQKGCFPGRLLR